MNKSIIEQEFQRIYAPYKEKKQIRTVSHLNNDTGTGEMQCYDIAPGILISYDSFNMDSCFEPITLQEDFLQINHCLEGCYECELEDHSITFLGEGDLAISKLCRDCQTIVNSRIPLKKYRGITILLEISSAQKTLNKDFPQANIDLAKIRDNLCSDGDTFLIKSEHKINQLFSDLYSVDTRIELPYFWIKIIELLLYLSILDNTHMQKNHKFSAEIAQGTQEAYQYIIQSPFSKITIKELAKMFNVAESSMKRCFKSLSGSSIGDFMKHKRMEAAAQLLISKQELNIGEIAGIAGYENQSKFSSAFKSVYGMTPFEYRYKSC